MRRLCCPGRLIVHDLRYQLTPTQRAGAAVQIDARLLLLPFASQRAESLIDILIREFNSDQWSRFYGAIGFAKVSGNFPDLLDAMRAFVQRSGTELSITFGADVFGGDTRGSDYEAVKAVLEALERADNARVYLYHERGRTFHPKLYLFSNEAAQKALLILGSSNWSEGGFVENIEANVMLLFELTNPEHHRAYNDLVSHFTTYWREEEEENA